MSTAGAAQRPSPRGSSPLSSARWADKGYHRRLLEDVIDSEAPPKPDPLSLIGKQLLGRYTVRDKLASGGMSVVLRAQDERLQRPVCVKVFHGIDRALPEYQTNYEHFVQEAFALSQLQHPNTIRIYDFGYLEQAPHSPFFVSELMTGGTLQNHLRKHGPLSPEQALGILEPVVHALAEAHGHNIIHRDIKPSNILFGKAGDRQIVKLADFGIAKAHLDEDERSIPNRASDTRAAKGGRRISLYSPGWAAPEQMRARPVGPTADVFALGLLLAYMLSGKKIFSEENVLEAFSKRMEGDKFLGKAIADLHLPAPIAGVISRACHAEPKDRYPGVEAFLAAFREAAAAPAPREEALEEEPITDGAGVSITALSPSLVTALERLDAEVAVGGRRVLLLPAAAPLDLGGDDEGAVDSPARLRLTFLPASTHVHLKGLNCFVVKPGGRPSSAADVAADTLLELRRPGAARLDAVRVGVGKALDATRWLHAVEGQGLTVPLALAPRSVLLDFGPGRALVLAYSIWG